MRINHLIQNQIVLAKKVKIKSIRRNVNHIAGVDVAFTTDFLFGCICVFLFPSLKLAEYAYAKSVHTLPYIPGFLSYREAPVILKAFKKLKTKPGLILVDGQGIAHRRSLGLASHLGILLGVPTIGCAKSHLYGDNRMPKIKKGSFTVIKDGQRKLGFVLRTRDSVNPLYVSPGHLVDFNDCLKYVLSSTTKYRIPEPIRFAHKMAGEKARQFEK